MIREGMGWSGVGGMMRADSDTARWAGSGSVSGAEGQWRDGGELIRSCVLHACLPAAALLACLITCRPVSLIACLCALAHRPRVLAYRVG